ncbi:MAG: tetratricopeptide repeat protein [Acidobacteriota bacterium]
MKTRGYLILAVSLVIAANASGFAKWFHGKSKKSDKQGSTSVLIVDSGLAGCKVDIDGVGAGITDSKGTLLIEGVEAGDHYLHVQCPKQREVSYFISPQPGQKMQMDAQSAATSSHAPEVSPLDFAASEMELRHMVSQASQLRASGRFKEAIEALRKATVLDPRNSDLHRELGITFLMIHDWERARVEMLEAIRHDPGNVDAHSGLAYALEKLGDLNGALKEYRLCTKMDPHDTSYRDHYVEVLGLLYTQQKQKKH